MKIGKTRWVALLLSFFLVLPSAVTLAEDNGTATEDKAVTETKDNQAATEDKAVTTEKKEFTGRVQLESQKYPLGHYQLESKIEDSGMNPFSSANIDKAKLGAVNMLWGFNKVFASFTIFAVENLMNFDLISKIFDQMAVMSERINETMIKTFFTLFIVLVGGVAAYRYFAIGREGEAYKALISAFFILLASYWFFSDTASNMKAFNEWGSQLEGIAASTNVVFSAENMDESKEFSAKEGTAILENQLFDLMVMRPYLLMNYGTSNESGLDSRVDDLLQANPNTKEGAEKRQEVIQKEIDEFNNEYMSSAYNNERLGITLLTIVSTVGLSIPVLILASAKFLLQVMLMALLIFAGVPLSIALIPTYAETAVHWFKKVIGVLMLKAGLVLLIAVMVGLSSLIYESLKTLDGVESYLFIVFLMIITLVGLFRFRNHLFEVVSNGYVVGQRTAQRMTEAVQQPYERAGGIAGDLTSRGAKNIRRSTAGYLIHQATSSFRKANGKGREPYQQTENGQAIVNGQAINSQTGGREWQSRGKSTARAHHQGAGRLAGRRMDHSGQNVVSLTDRRQQREGGRTPAPASPSPQVSSTQRRMASRPSASSRPAASPQRSAARQPGTASKQVPSAPRPPAAPQRQQTPDRSPSPVLQRAATETQQTAKQQTTSRMTANPGETNAKKKSTSRRMTTKKPEE